MLNQSKARALWIRAQRLHESEPFSKGEGACGRAIEHLGYVQIDTINVIERCHHHILYNRIPTYHQRDLRFAQSTEKSVFEYWTHALSYVPTKDFRFFLPAMLEHRRSTSRWFGTVDPADIGRILKVIKSDGALTIRDVGGDTLIEKTHPWASKKPSKKALEFAFYRGQVAIAERMGMLKKYELTERHFGWEKRPKPARPVEVLNYQLDRALRTQALISLDSVA